MRASEMHLQRSSQMLTGYLQGIAADGDLSDTEIASLQNWLGLHHALRGQFPFDEISEFVEHILGDSVVDPDEREELIEWCANLSLDSNHGYRVVDTAIRELHGFLHGMISDGRVTSDEAYGLHDWLQYYRHFRGTWPFSDTFQLIESILADDHIAEDELGALEALCNEFSERPINHTPHDILDQPWQRNAGPHLEPISYLCDDLCEIEFPGRCFCFTGSAKSGKRKDLHSVVASLGGRCTDSIVQSLDYLIVGDASSPLWFFASYGRKVEQARGQCVPIVTESRFLAAVQAVAVKA